MQTIADAYQHFSDLHGRETPDRTMEELRELIHAADLRYDQIGATAAFWDLAFGDAEGSWALGTLDWPTEAQWTDFRQAVHAEEPID